MLKKCQFVSTIMRMIRNKKCILTFWGKNVKLRMIKRTVCAADQPICWHGSTSPRAELVDVDNIDGMYKAVHWHQWLNGLNLLTLPNRIFVTTKRRHAHARASCRKGCAGLRLLQAQVVSHSVQDYYVNFRLKYLFLFHLRHFDEGLYRWLIR